MMRNKFNLKNILITIFATLILACLFLLSDYLYQFVNPNFVCSDKLKIFKLLIPLCFGLVINKSKFFIVFCIVFLFLLQMVQFAHISYFGTQLSPYDFYQFFDEYHDVFQEVRNVYFKYWKTILIVIVPFGLMIPILKLKGFKSYFGVIILFATFGWIYYSNCFIRNSTVNEYRFTIDNTLKSFSCFLDLSLRGYNPKPYKSYTIMKTSLNNEPINIVYILGESANYRHMSLFGYERNTTSGLIKLSKESDFYYTKGIAGGILTKSSLKFMMNVIGEPDNTQLSYGDKTNLFKLAKENGFKTFYISDQLEGLISIISGKKYIDEIRTASRDKNFDIYTDQHIITVLNQQTFSKHNFIVLHQRSVHTPYSKVFSKDFLNRRQFSGAENSIIDEYDNAMLYNDYIISDLFNHFNKQKTGKFYIIWASDHNDLLGEKGLFGHGHGALDPITADIPVIVQTNDKDFLDNFKKIYRPNHYEITKYIARLLGYEIINSNEDGKTFYISGVDFNGKCGYIKYEKDSGKRKVTYFNEK